jgi:hypothetical protein
MRDHIFDVKKTFDVFMSIPHDVVENVLFRLNCCELQDYDFLSRFLFRPTLQIDIYRFRVQLSHFTLSDLEDDQRRACVNLIAHPKKTLGHYEASDKLMVGWNRLDSF